MSIPDNPTKCLNNHTNCLESENEQDDTNTNGPHNQLDFLNT